MTHTQPTAEQLELARECAVTAAHSARFDDEILSFWVTAWSDRAKGIFEEGATQSALLAIQATEARMSAAVEALEAVLPFTRAEELAEAAQVRLRKSDRNPVHKAVTKARQALAEIRSVTNG